MRNGAGTRSDLQSARLRRLCPLRTRGLLYSFLYTARPSNIVRSASVCAISSGGI